MRVQMFPTASPLPPNTRRIGVHDEVFAERKSFFGELSRFLRHFYDVIAVPHQGSEVRRISGKSSCSLLRELIRILPYVGQK